jgi:Tfp pilus assembly ATPase PilU
MDLSLNLKALISQRLMPKQDGKGRSGGGRDHAQFAR